MSTLDRRGFLRGLGMAVAGLALEQAIPLGRVWSFPSNIVVPANHILPMGFAVPIEYTKLIGLHRDMLIMHATQATAFSELSSVGGQGLFGRRHRGD